jgi:hypothetical protein
VALSSRKHQQSAGIRHKRFLSTVSDECGIAKSSASHRRRRFERDLSLKSASADIASAERPSISTPNINANKKKINEKESRDNSTEASAELFVREVVLFENGKRLIKRVRVGVGISESHSAAEGNERERDQRHWILWGKGDCN